MKERGMIFNAEMVRAILDGRKTQTRRLVNPEPDSPQLLEARTAESGYVYAIHANRSNVHQGRFRWDCPFGKPGDRIWVRETFGDCGERLVYRADTDDGAQCKVNRWTPSIHMPRCASRITLEITGVRVERLNDISHEDAGREGIHTEVWDQTVVARNYAAEDEFFQFWSESMPHYVEMNELYRASFHSLWQSIYGEESFLANPWVWVIDFRRIEGGAA